MREICCQTLCRAAAPEGFAPRGSRARRGVTHCPHDPPYQHELKGQARPEQRFAPPHNTAGGVEAQHLDVGRKNGYEQQHEAPPRNSANARHQKSAATQYLGQTAHRHEQSRRWQVRRHDGAIAPRHNQMQDASADEKESQRHPPAIATRHAAPYNSAPRPNSQGARARRVANADNANIADLLLSKGRSDPSVKPPGL